MVSSRYITVITWMALALVIVVGFYEVYKWADNKGVMQLADNLENIPVGDPFQSGNPHPESSVKSASNAKPQTPLLALVLREMLLNKEFEKLNISLSDYQKAYEKDVQKEDDLIDAYFAFSVSGTDYEELLNQWVDSHPDSYQPYLARASYFHYLGWESRGGKWASETSHYQIKKMQEYFTKAKWDIEKSLKQKQDHIVPYYVLINILKTTDERDEIKAIVDQALAKCPESFRIRSAYLLSITPRWGGSYEEMDRFAIEAQRHATKNTRLKALKGYAFYDIGDMQSTSKNHGLALEFLNKALAFGQESIFYEERSLIYEHLDRQDDALADINMAINLNPRDADFYYARSRILSNKEMFQEALKDTELADQLNPNNEEIAKQRKRIAEHLKYSGYSQEKSKNLSGAINDYSSSIQADPGNADSYYRRARAYIDKKDLVSAFNDLKAAIELNPEDFEYYLLMDWVLTQNSNFDDIIDYWNKYIALNPDDDRAYLERGGAYFRKGDVASAVADAKRAADLGNAEGRKLYDRYKGRVKSQI